MAFPTTGGQSKGIEKADAIRLCLTFEKTSLHHYQHSLFTLIKIHFKFASFKKQ